MVWTHTVLLNDSIKVLWDCCVQSDDNLQHKPEIITVPKETGECHITVVLFASNISMKNSFFTKTVEPYQELKREIGGNSNTYWSSSIEQEVTDEELMRPHAESLLIESSWDHQKDLGYLRLCVTSCSQETRTTLIRSIRWDIKLKYEY